MRTASLTLALLVAAALAGCTGGTSDVGQATDRTETGTGTVSASQNRTATTDGPGQHRGRDHTYEPSLEADPANGTVPLDVTLSFSATWQDSGRRAGQDGNRSAGSNGTAGGAANRTGNQGEHALNRGHDDVTWTLEVRFNATATAAAGNGTGNGTADGGSGGNSTGNGATGPAGNSTGNQTGDQAGNGTAMADGTVVASFNGTGEELPGNRTVTLDQTGSYDAVFTVQWDGGSAAARQPIAVGGLPPGTPLGNETRTFEGSFLVSEPLLCLGSEEHEWILNETFKGAAADAARLNVTIDAGGFSDIEVTLTAPNGTEVASGASIDVEGPFPAGNYTLVAESCVAADAEYTITAVAHYTTKGFVASAKGDAE